MTRFVWPAAIVAAGILLMSAACSDSNEPPADPGNDGWMADFTVAPQDFASVGRNPYFILEPGYRLRLEGDGVELVISVLNETKVVDGVETRIVEERESEDGELTEIARNYFAIDRRTNDVYYFGEDVDFYKDGKVTGHEGTWYSGVDGAKYGLAMPAQITIGAQYYQEVAPEVALDRAKNISVTETIKTPAGEFKDVLKVEETNPLEKNAREFKYYAPGVGLIQDAELKLVAYGKQ